MMKIKNTLSSFILICLTVSFCNAQTKATAKLPIDETSKLVTYAGVVEIAGIKADSLYNRALIWANTYFKNPADVIREKDQEAGKIVCKARYKIMNPPDKTGFQSEGGVVMYTMNLMFKDGRYRYEITEINWKQASYYPVEKWMDTENAYYKPEFASYLQQVDEKSKELVKDLDKGMKTTAPKKKDDW